MKNFGKIMLLGVLMASANLVYGKLITKTSSKANNDKICLVDKTAFNKQSKSNFTGKVRTLVRVLVNGKVKEVKILDSSKDMALDNLVIKTVQQIYYPYNANDPKLKGITEIRIIRTWEFKNGKLVNDVC